MTMKLMSISFLRTFAALIIINSHCGSLYPVSALAKGGALGNSLFFLMSGFLLYPIKLAFFEWVKKRYIRLYIPIFILGLVLIIAGGIEINLYNVFFRFIFPEHRWFVCALIIMYPIFYFINQKYQSIRDYICCGLVLLALYVFVYCSFLDTSKYIIESVGFHGIRFSYIFSFFLMLTGGFVHSRIEIIINKLKLLRKGRFFIYLVTFFSIVFYFSFIFLMNKYHILCRYQFFETIFCIMTTLGIFLTAVINEDSFRNIKCKWFTKLLEIGDYTLEIYLIQFLVIEFVKNHCNRFPVNIILVFIVTIAIAVVFNKIVKMIDKYIVNS